MSFQSSPVPDSSDQHNRRPAPLRTGNGASRARWCRFLPGSKINGATVKTKTDRNYPTGDAGVSTGGWYQVHFTNLKITPVG